MARIRINTRTHTKEKPYPINSYFFFSQLIRQKRSIGWVKYVYVCEWDMCWRNFCNLPWWLENVKSRSKIALFSNEHHFEIWFPKKRTITFFWSKLFKLYKKRPNFACGNYIFPKTRRKKNKLQTHSTSLNQFSVKYRFSFPILRFLPQNHLALLKDRFLKKKNAFKKK